MTSALKIIFVWYEAAVWRKPQTSPRNKHPARIETEWINGVDDDWENLFLGITTHMKIKIGVLFISAMY